MAVASTAQPGGGSESSSAGDGRKGGKPMYTLAQFRAVGDLGAGSFGTVRKMVHEETGEVFAMKVLEKERVVQRDLQEQLKREVLTQLRVKHMNVVRLHYYFEDAARIYCLLEYADGGQLFAYLRRQPGGVPEPRAAQLFGDTASGLAYLHSLRIAHRDLKPENILLFTQALRAKIGDFGWCVELTPEAPTRRTFCGTLDYLAPEMLTSSPHDTTVDLWALGVLLYEMLLAKAPFTAGSQKETMERICAVRFDIPRGSMSSGPEALVRGLLVLEGGKRMPLSQVLHHQWLAASSSSQPGTDDSIILDVTRAAPGRGGGAATDAASLDATRIAPRRGGAATSAAAADAVSLDATRIAPRRVGAGGAGKEPAGGQGAADSSLLLDRTVTVQRRQAGPGGAPASGGGEAAGAGDAGTGLLEQTRVVPRRRPREAGPSQPEEAQLGRQTAGGLDDTDPSMPALQAAPKGFAFPSATQAARPGAWSSERSGGKKSDSAGNVEEDAHISLDDLDGRMLGSGGGGASQRGGGGREGDFWIIRTEYVASCNPRPKVRSRRGTRTMEV